MALFLSAPHIAILIGTHLPDLQRLIRNEADPGRRADLLAAANHLSEAVLLLERVAVLAPDESVALPVKV